MIAASLLLPLLFATPSADAARVPIWDRTTFGNDAIAGTDGWSNGYAADRWFATQGVAIAATDHNNGDSPGRNGYGSGWAADNWLIRGELVAQGSVQATIENEDDDAIGLVWQQSGPNSFYLCGHTADSVPPAVPAQGVGNGKVFLLRVDGGQPTLVGEAALTLNASTENTWRIEHNDGQIACFVNGNLRLSFQDPAPLPPGKAGFWSYDAGYDGSWDNSNTIFDDIAVSAFDDDDDGVIDDEDNCERVANTDQSDTNNDGIGDACTTGGESDTDTDTDSDTDTDTDVDTDTDTDPTDTANPGDTAGFTAEKLRAGSACGCAQTGGAPLGFVLLAPLWLVRRRRA